MNKNFMLSMVFFVLVFLGSCTDDEIIPDTGNPSAQPLFSTMTEIAKTLEVIGQTATSYSYTPTFTPTPTKTPNRDAVRKQINDSINEQLISNFDANIKVKDVKFGPIGGQVLTDLYIEINCTGNTSTGCPTNQVIVAVVTACKEKKKNVIANIPRSTEMLTITIFDSAGSQPRVVEINWSDVMAYLNGDVSGDIFYRLIRYVQ